MKKKSFLRFCVIALIVVVSLIPGVGALMLMGLQYRKKYLHEPNKIERTS
jgi:hypothetical protein